MVSPLKLRLNCHLCLDLIPLRTSSLSLTFMAERLFSASCNESFVSGLSSSKEEPLVDEAALLLSMF
jgi:hypothetical protein